MIVVGAPPAIIIPKPVADWRFIVNDGRQWDCGSCLPRDFREMPKALRRLVPADEIRGWLPEPYRLLGDDLLWTLILGKAAWLANVPALPSAILAGGVKYGYLFTASGSFTVPSDWNIYDNAIHCVSKGGNGHAAAASTLVPGTYYGGSGGGGSAYAGLVNASYTAGDLLTVTIGTTCWFDATGVLLADPGGNGGGLSGGTMSGGSAGDAASSAGNVRHSGNQGGTASGNFSATNGQYGGAAAGPNGSPSGIYADSGYGGQQGNFTGDDGQDGIDGPGGGWNRRGAGDNAGSGGAGAWGGDIVPRNGGDGGKFGGGGGGGGANSGGLGAGGTGGGGCVLAINNASA